MSDFWNERYSGADYFYGTQANEFLISVSDMIPKGSKVLCIAEGEGRNAVFLASHSSHVTAVDASSEGKKKALALASKMGVEIDYQLSDLESFDFGEEKWDAIVSIFCHLAVTIRPAIHQKVEKALKPNGLFIFQSYNPKQLEFNSGGPKEITMLNTDESMRSEFNSLTWLKLENSMAEIHEGAGHHGMSSLLSGIGVKKN
jgi:cyclopropane fatty-acyl-phospholipid synthase-like methyltransferase